MELGKIGEHCSLCGQLDFLPFKCTGCSKVFCLKHKSTSSHSCPGDSSREISSETKGEPQPEKKYENPYKCSLPGCREKQLHPCICKRCQNNFCLKHRFDIDH